ncbi:hypothetical protein KSF73_17175 [Burkholderiaceae bacterium DAT-1]|nr:hypothetical protein [Burkholderiaceae bacterium DAT-1]
MPTRNGQRLNAHELSVLDWKYPDEGALPEGPVRDGYFARKKAITLYLQGAIESEVKKQTGLGLSQTRRLIKERCLQVHMDGEVWGWRALVPWERINSYQRKHKIDIDKFGQGAVGVFNTVLNQHPELRENFTKRILAVGSRNRLSVYPRNKQSHWKWFLGELRARGYEAENKWPFNTKNMGYVSVCRFVKSVLAENPESAAFVVGGPDNKKKMLSGDGTNRPVNFMFQRVEMDAHKIDGRFSVMIPQPTGGYVQKIVHRLWVVVILEVMSRAVLGYHLSMRKEVSKVDVLRALKMALTKYKRMPITFGENAYYPKANLPSAASEKFIGACWDETSVDGSLAETCKHVRQVLKEVVGSDLLEPENSFAMRRSKDDRPFIETFFRTLGQRGFQRLPNTTGAKPTDKGGRDPDEIALTSQFQLEYASELLAVLIANYNATPHSSLGGRSPLDYLEFRMLYPERSLRYADSNSVSDMVSFRKLCLVHGGYAQGRRPFVYFAHGRYTSDILGQRHDLVGKKIWVINHIEDDVRIVRASTEGGQPLGVLQVSSPWNRLPHSLEVRNSVASCINSGKLKVVSGQDAIEAFIDYSERQKGKKLPVHPAYLEARRILIAIAEEREGRSMIEIANERQTHETTLANTDRVQEIPATRSTNSHESSRSLPAPRKAANN